MKTLTQTLESLRQVKDHMSPEGIDSAISWIGYIFELDVGEMNRLVDEFK